MSNKGKQGAKGSSGKEEMVTMEAIRAVLAEGLTEMEDRLASKMDRMGAWFEQRLEACETKVEVLTSRIIEIEAGMHLEKGNSNEEVGSDREDKVLELEEKLEELENRARRNYIIISGISEEKNEKVEEARRKLMEFLEKELGLVGIEFDGVHRLGRRRDNGDRPIIGKVLRREDKEKILRNRSKLKGTNIYINEDFAKNTRVAREELRKYAKRQKEKTPEIRNWLKKDRLEMNGKEYFFDKSESRVREGKGS